MNSIEGIYLNTLVFRDISFLPKLPPRRREAIHLERDEIKCGDPFQIFDNHPNLICRKFYSSYKECQV